jgi:integrase
LESKLVLQKLIKSNIDKIKAPEHGQQFYWDPELTGFGLRVTASGSKTYIVEKRINGKTVRRTIGKHGIFSPDEARKESRKALLSMVLGKDPRAITRSNALLRTTLDEVYANYKSKRDLKPRTLAIYDDAMKRGLSQWRDLPVTEINRQMVETLLLDISSKNSTKGVGRSMAGQCYRFLRALMKFAQEEYEIDDQPILKSDPTRNLSRNRPWTETTRRQGLLERHEISAWLNAVENLDNETISDYLMLTLLTGLRKNEALSLKWSDINLQGKYLKIDASTSKNSKEHVLPLSDYLYNMLKRRLEQTQLTSIYVFPGKKTNSHLKEPKRAVSKVIEVTGKKFMLHDLRRTFLTTAESLGLEGFTLKKLVNHSVGNDVTAGYIIADMERLRAPMQAVTDAILTHSKTWNVKHTTSQS